MNPELLGADSWKSKFLDGELIASESGTCMFTSRLVQEGCMMRGY